MVGTEGTRPTSFRVGSSFGLPKVLRSLGCSVQAVFDSAGIDPALYQDPENRISAADLGRLFACAARATGRQDIALLAINETGAGSLGIVSEIIAEGPDLRTSLRNLVRLLQHNTLAGYPVFDVAERMVTMKFELREADFPGSEFVLDGATGITLRIVQWACGKNWHPDEVHLSRRAPAEAARYRAFFGTAVVFSSIDDGIIFAAEWLDHVVPRERLRRASNRLRAAAAPTSELVRRQLAMRIGLEPVTAEAVAHDIGLSRRRLFELLKAEGTTFQKLLDEARFARARHLLAAGDAPLAQIAFALGFPEQSSFNRSFLRWCHSSPRDWRAMNAQPRVLPQP